MNCREFEEILPDLASDEPPEALEAAARAHAVVCPRCRGFLAVIAPGHSTSLVAEDRAEDLTAAILRRTSGAVCSRIEERLCRWVDQSVDAVDGVNRSIDAVDWVNPSIDAVDRVSQPIHAVDDVGRPIDPVDGELITQHLSHCPDCVRLVDALRFLRMELPEMAEPEPDPGILEAVLEQTSRRKGRRSAWAAAQAWWWRATTQVSLRWDRLTRRPRIALELAYCGAMIILIISGPPGRPAGTSSGFPAHATPITAAMDLWQQEQPFDKLVFSVRQVFIRDVARPAARKAETLSPRLARSGRRIQRTLILARNCGRDLGQALLRADMVSAWHALSRFEDQVRRSVVDPPVDSSSPGGGEPDPERVRHSR